MGEDWPGGSVPPLLSRNGGAGAQSRHGDRLEAFTRAYSTMVTGQDTVPGSGGNAGQHLPWLHVDTLSFHLQPRR